MENQNSNQQRKKGIISVKFRYLDPIEWITRKDHRQIIIIITTIMQRGMYLILGVIWSVNIQINSIYAKNINKNNIPLNQNKK